MWSRVRGAVIGMAERAGIEVPGLDSAATAVSDLAGSAGDAAAGVAAEVGASDLAGSVTDLAASDAPNGLVAGAADAATSVTETVAGVVGEVPTTAGALLDAVKGRLAP